MDDYISKTEAFDIVRFECGEWSGLAKTICKRFDYLPHADVQPVRHGQWETINGWDGDELYRCSECGAEFVLIYGTPKDNGYWFCPHCGADMRGEQDETD